MSKAKPAQPLGRRQSYFTELSGEKVLADYSRVSSLEKRLQKPSFKKSGSIVPKKNGISLGRVQLFIIMDTKPKNGKTHWSNARTPTGWRAATGSAGGVNRPQQAPLLRVAQLSPGKGARVRAWARRARETITFTRVRRHARPSNFHRFFSILYSGAGSPGPGGLWKRSRRLRGAGKRGFSVRNPARNGGAARFPGCKNTLSAPVGSVQNKPNR